VLSGADGQRAEGAVDLPHSDRVHHLSRDSCCRGTGLGLCAAGAPLGRDAVRRARLVAEWRVGKASGRQRPESPSAGVWGQAPAGGWSAVASYRLLLPLARLCPGGAVTGHSLTRTWCDTNMVLAWSLTSCWIHRCVNRYLPRVSLVLLLFPLSAVPARCFSFPC